MDADNPEVLARVHSLAVSLENLGERSTAAKLYRRAYDGRCKRLGKDHRDALDSGLNLAACCRNSGNEKEACELFKALQEGAGREAKTPIWSRKKPIQFGGKVRWNVYQFCYIWKMVSGCQRVLGPHHLVTLETTEQLADLLLSSDVVAAWKLRRQLLESYRSAYGEELQSRKPHPQSMGKLEIWNMQKISLVLLFGSLFVTSHVGLRHLQDDPSALGAMAKLAHVLATAASKGCASVTAASEALKASLARQRQVLGGNSPEAMKAEDDLRKLGHWLDHVGLDFFRNMDMKILWSVHASTISMKSCVQLKPTDLL